MSITQSATSAGDLRRLANDHLWLHFTRMGGYDPPIIVRGDGCYLEDANGKRYLDALAGLFSVNIGYGFGDEIGQAAHEQMKELPFYTNWSYAHPRAIELAAEVGSLAPGDLNRVFFVNGGSEAVEAAWKLARQYYQARGTKRLRTDLGGLEGEIRHDEHLASPPGRKYKAIAREVAYHGTTFGALSINGISSLRVPFEPLVPEVRHVSNTNRYHRPAGETEEQFTAFLLDELEKTIISMGPETVCLVHMEPIQNAGGSFVAPEGYWRGVREICDRYDILLSADEVITGFGRVGYWFASERYDIRPDIVTCAKGLSSSYAAIGAVIATDRVMEPFLQDTFMYSHGITFGGHPVMSAIALKNIEIMKRERILEHVRENEEPFRATLGQLLDLPIVGDLRGTGFFYALELVKDKETRETFSDEECESLLRGFLSPRLFERGLICRADDRGDPVIQISPPLVATQSQFDEMTGILGDVLAEAWEQMH
jgi:adenosylmethionine-8-amino-7-oxononanoate aminotransferase